MEIDITSEKERFKEHLGLPNNNQIIFSGIFGIGKTYFLKKFFETETKEIESKEGKPKEYEPFFLTPVNYSISSNDDIIDYIKYDLAFELLRKDIEFEKSNFSALFTAPLYLKNNFLDTLSLLVQSGGKIGRELSRSFDNLRKIITNIKKHNKNIQIDEEKEFTDFLKRITTQNRSIYEENEITELISGLIGKLKEEGKETVLVIDDLDRLDPEHIFRILNVFACHFDIGGTSGNKFGVDKIVLVCDIENIRNLFHSKYGVNTDFSGYIDKFYSSEIFYFDNKQIVSETIDTIIGSITFEKFIIDLKGFHDRSNKVFKGILEGLIHNDLLNLRTLLKMYNSNCEIKEFRFRINKNGLERSNLQFEIMVMFELLISFYGATSSLENALEKLAEKEPTKIITDDEMKDYNNSYFYNYNYNYLLVLVDYKNHKGKEGKFQYDNEDLDLSIEYKITYDDSPIYSDADIILKSEKATPFEKLHEEKNDFPFASLLNIAFKEYLNLTRVNI